MQEGESENQFIEWLDWALMDRMQMWFKEQEDVKVGLWQNHGPQTVGHRTEAWMIVPEADDLEQMKRQTQLQKQAKENMRSQQHKNDE